MPSSSSSEKKNIVIIGGGIIGSTTAYYLTRHPSFSPTQHTITVLEASAIASGASGKAGGLLALWAYPSNIVPLSFKLHKELAQEHNGAEKWGYRNVGCGSIQISGRKTAMNQPTDGVSLEKLFAGPKRGPKIKRMPKDLDWILPELVEGYEAMAGDGETAQVHPYQFTTSIMGLAEAAGAKVVFGSAKRINHVDDDETKGVRSVAYVEKDSGEQKELEATDVIVTAGPWTSRILEEVAIEAQRAHSITITPAKPVSAYCLFTEISIPSANKTPATRAAPEIYARPNNEVYICGEGDTEVTLPELASEVVVDTKRCEGLVENAAAISDHLKYGEVTRHQACYLPNCSNGGGPLIGKTKREGVLVAAGHTCWGIQNGPATGKLMSEFVFEGAAKSADVKRLDPRRYI